MSKVIDLNTLSYFWEKIKTLFAGKQDTLVSGTNIKTINGNSVLGSGNINIQGGGGEQSDWNVTDTSSMAYIKNKPTIPAAQVQSDWNEASTSSKAYILNKPTIPSKTSDLTNDSCPIIEDTRSQATDVNITGAAPFATLAGGQRIVLHFKYANTASPTLQLTLSGGTTTSAYSLYQNYNNGVNALTLQAMPAGSYGEFVFDSTNSRWVLIGKDFNTTYSNTSQSDINNSAQGSRLIEPKLLRDNFYTKTETNSIAYIPVVDGHTTTPSSLDPNKLYDFGTVSSALTIPDFSASSGSLTGLVSNALNFYALRFIAGADNLSITFPTGVQVDDEPTINTGDYVEIMINLYVVNNTNKFYGSIKVWQAQSQS